MGFMYILLALIIFGLLIFIHELGHFLVARCCGVEILEFSIGMGPKILSKKSKKSGIIYSLRLLPIGGFVSMLGENGMELAQGGKHEDKTPDETANETVNEAANETSNEQVSPYKDEFLVNDLNDTEKTEEIPAVPVDPERMKHAYCNQPIWKRILISIAGPLMNVLLGFILMLVMVLAAGPEGLGSNRIGGFFLQYTVEDSVYGLKNGDYLLSVDGTTINSYEELTKAIQNDADGEFLIKVLRYDEETSAFQTKEINDTELTGDILKTLFTTSRSEQSGLKVGDTVVKVNSTPVHTYNELAYEIINQGYRAVNLTVIRDGEKLVLENVIFPVTVDRNIKSGDPDFKIYRDSYQPLTIIKHTWYRSLSTVKMVFDSIGGLASGRYSVNSVSGPVGITQTISTAAKTGWMNLLYLVIVISINLGIMNLLPLPALDGGHLLLYIIEAIRRKKMKPETEAIINFVGLVLLLALMAVVTIKDVISL